MRTSSRRLAASYWERYGGLLPDQDDEDLQGFHTTYVSRSHASFSPSPPLNTRLRDSALADCQTSGLLKHKKEGSRVEDGSNISMGAGQAATLMNVIHRMTSIEEVQSRNMAVFNKLRLDVDIAATRIQELEFSHKSTLKEINNFLHRTGEQMAVSRRNEQEKLRLTFLQLREEMEEERNACRMLQMQNKKLSEGLTHANLATADACEELNRERKARELLEEVCNELAREIGEDKAEVEQLKQEQEESRERLEKELKLMKVAAMWREQKVRNKLEEAKLELEYGDKQGNPLHESRGKLEVVDNMAAVAECSKFQEQIVNHVDQTKLPTPVIERKPLDDGNGIDHNVENMACAGRLNGVPAWLDAHFSKDMGLNMDSCSGSGIFKINGLEERFDINNTRKHRKFRRRLRANGQEGNFFGVLEPQTKVRNASSARWKGNHCMNPASSSSDGEVDGRRAFTQQNCLLQTKEGFSQADWRDALNLHDNPISVIDDDIDVTKDVQEIKAPVCSLFGKGDAVEEPTRLETLLNDTSHRWSTKKHSSSARFEVGKLSCVSETDLGRRIQNCFSDDDASSYITSHTERGRKQDGRISSSLQRKGLQDQASLRSANKDDGTLIFEGIREGEAIDGHRVELDNGFFGPLRGPMAALLDKEKHKANEDEGGPIKLQPERGLSHEMGLGTCGDNSCCGVMSKCGQLCKELKADEKSACRTVGGSQDAEGSMISGLQETSSKLSPWRSATGKPLQCLWPPSPDSFSIFGGSKRRFKSTSSMSVNVGNDSGLAWRNVSPAKQAVHHEPVTGQKLDVPCMRSNSLGAQLIKARVCDSEKPLKASFGFSPFRRAISHG